MKILLLVLAGLAQAQQNPLPQGYFDGAIAANDVGPAKIPPPPKNVAGAPVSQANVILLMWDGVRAQELFTNKPDPSLSKDAGAVFPSFYSSLLGQGLLFGDDSGASPMKIANLAMISLPAYQSIMAGATQPCMSNNCGRVGTETFEERLVRELGLSRSEVATVASWEEIANAVEHTAGATTVDVSTYTRWDKQTFPQAMSYLQTAKPRFLFISLNDADEWAHRGEYGRYLATLRQYDDWLKQLTATLDGMGDYGKHTTLILTTDHGRGLGPDWKDHGGRPSAVNIWLYARGPGLSAHGRSSASHSHLDIRPTVEKLLGLAPLSGTGLGSPFSEIAP